MVHFLELLVHLLLANSSSRNVDGTHSIDMTRPLSCRSSSVWKFPEFIFHRVHILWQLLLAVVPSSCYVYVGPRQITLMHAVDECESNPKSYSPFSKALQILPSRQDIRTSLTTLSVSGLSSHLFGKCLVTNRRRERRVFLCLGQCFSRT